MRRQFLELSVPTGDIRESLDFYVRLGFTELEVNDIRGHYYAVVSDGRIAIGLHADGFDAPTLSLVWQDVAREVRALQEAGHEFTFAEFGIDRFHEAEITSPDGHPARLVEARTFSRHPDTELPEPIVGRSAELTLRCRSLEPEIAFWQALDFVTDADDTDPDSDYIALRAPGVQIGLSMEHRWPEPALRFAATPTPDVLEELERRDISRRRNGDDWLIIAPEGTRLLLAAGA